MYSAAARAPPTSSISTEPCSGSAVESTSTIGQAGATDLLDLGMAVRQADGDDAVDGGAAHRPRQAAVQRRDEVEAVAVLLGGQRHALAEGAEERVAEDDAEGLRREHADRHRLALGEHPRDRVRAVAQVLRDLADPRAPSRARAGPGELNANDTAVLLTPASRATSAIRGRWVPCSTRLRLLRAAVRAAVSS